MSPNASAVQAYAKLDQEQFFEGLRLLRRHARPHRAAKAVIWREGEDLVVGLGGGEVRTPMTGRWEGQARLQNARILLESTRQWSTRPPFTVRVESNRLFFSGFSLPCEWEANSSPHVLLPIEASLMDLLLVGSNHSDVALQEAGYLDAIRDARQSRAKIVRAAARDLKPLGVTEEDVERIVRERFEETRSRFGDGR